MFVFHLSHPHSGLHYIVKIHRENFLNAGQVVVCIGATLGSTKISTYLTSLLMHAPKSPDSVNVTSAQIFTDEPNLHLYTTMEVMG